MINLDKDVLKQQLISQFGADQVMSNGYGSQSASKKLLNNKYVLKILLDEDLVNTAKLFLENNLSIAKASEAGFMHRNTLIYRLGVIERLIGLDIRKFNDAVVLNNIFVANKTKLNNHE